MGVLINKYSWVVNLLTITVCAFLAAKTVSHLVEANLPQMKPSTRRTPALTGAPERNNPGREIAAILKRNIFCSTCEQGGASAAAALPADAPLALKDEQAVKTTLNLRLIATLTSDEAGDGNYASILNMASNKVQLYSVGATVPGDGLITDILDRYVLLQANQRREYLALETGAGGPDRPGGVSAPAPPPAHAYRGPKPLPGLEKIAQGIKQVGRVRWEVSRGIIGQVLSNQSLLGRGARVIPVMKNGKPGGFRFFGRKGSVASLMGLYGGDTVKSINGHPVLSPNQALEVVSKLRTASYLTLTFDRKGQELTHEYVVR